MYNVELTEEIKAIINYERFHHPHPRIQMKMEVLWLKSQGLSTLDIARLSATCPNTVRTYLREYMEGGIEKVKEVRFRRPESEMNNYQATIEADFEENPPATIKEAKARIEELTGLVRSETQVRKFLKRKGMKRFKVGIIPEKANLQEQEEFLKKK